jgi:hypothetical protein
MADTIVCPDCGAEMSKYNQFCVNCGKEIGDTQPTGGQEETAERRSTGVDDHHGQGTDDQYAGDSQFQQNTAGQSRQRAGQPQRGAGGQYAGGVAGQPQGAPFQRKSAVDTVSQAFDWLTSFRTLAGVLVGFYVLNSAVQAFVPFSGVVSIVAFPVLAGITHAHVNRELQGETTDFGSAVEDSSDQILPLIGAAILSGIAVLFGLILLVIPGIYIGLRLSLALPAIAIDDYSTTDGLSASWEIADGNLLKILGVVAFVILITIAVSIPLGVIGLIAAGGLDSPVMFSIVTAPASAVAFGLSQLALARIYIENRESGAQQPGVDQQRQQRGQRGQRQTQPGQQGQQRAQPAEQSQQGQNRSGGQSRSGPRE